MSGAWEAGAHAVASVRRIEFDLDEGAVMKRGRIARTVARTIAATIAVAAVVATAADAAPVRIFRAQSAEAFGKGESDSVSIDATGAVALAPAAEKVATIEEPFAFALVGTKRGWAVGTGSEGRVLAIDETGATSIVLDADEPEIFALAAAPDGVLYAGSSPGGKVYRLEGGKSEPWFDPAETYIWAIAPAAGEEGALWVATGAPGRLYRVRGKEKAEMVWEGATHVRSLLPMPNGDLLFGTAGDGRLLRWRAGQVRTLYDSELTEVAALAAGADGSVWIALLASEASFVDLGARPLAPVGSGDEAKVAVMVDEEVVTGSRPPGAQGARSELLRLLPNGSVESVWSSNEETLFALAADGDGVWAATGLDGRLYRIDGGIDRGRARVERKLEAKQLVGLALSESARGGPAVLTTNGASLWRLIARAEAKGSYTSAVHDALQVAQFGVFRWQGSAPAGARVRASFRSGFSAEPDTTWSPWSEAREGSELALGGVERGRFVQYRLELEAGPNGGPRIVGTELSYRQENVRPAIQSFGAMEPGQILVAAGFNPADQLYEPASPNREGIFDSLRPTPPKGDRQKTVWRKGWLTVRWDVSDPNGDTLEAALAVRPEADPDGWLPLADELTESQWAFDATALPDGLYRFRFTASDAPGNEPSGGALAATRESEPVVIDQSPPELIDLDRRAALLSVQVSDAWNPLRQAEVSIDGSRWQAARVRDGLLDGRTETIELASLPQKAKLVLLRVVDAAWNVRTFDLLSELRHREGGR